LCTFADEELFISIVLYFQANRFLNSPHCFIDLLIEGFAWDVGTNCDVGMTCPNIEGSLVEITSLEGGFVAGLVISKGVELLRAICC
jgi:hypothetical protein